MQMDVETVQASPALAAHLQSSPETKALRTRMQMHEETVLASPALAAHLQTSPKPQVSKYYLEKKTSSSHSRNGKDDANHDSRMHPRSPLSRQSLTFDATHTYHSGGYVIDHDKLPSKSPMHLKSIRVGQRNICLMILLFINIMSSGVYTKAEVVDVAYCDKYATRVVGYCATPNTGVDCCASVASLVDMNLSDSCLCPVLESEAANSVGLTMETLLEIYVGCNATQPVEMLEDACSGSHSSEKTPPPVSPPPPAELKPSSKLKSHDKMPKKVIAGIFIFCAFVVIATGFLFTELGRRKRDSQYDVISQSDMYDIELGGPMNAGAQYKIFAKKEKCWSNALKPTVEIKKKRMRRPRATPDDAPLRRSERLKAKKWKRTWFDLE